MTRSFQQTPLAVQWKSPASGPFSGKLSQSIANFPIIDANGSAPIASANVRVIGFLQGFIRDASNSGPGHHVMAQGDNSEYSRLRQQPQWYGHTGRGTSAVPVRLISQ
jgi:hypothetical protein